jgi:hypothetical protein
MNANELADELTKMFRGEEYDRFIHEIPDMLRQQQEQIENLKQWERRHLDVIHSLERQLEVIREACARSRP